MVENHTLCADGEVARVGFMAPADVHAFTQLLEGHGLCYLREGEAIDLVVADQQRGLCAKSDWAEFGRIPWEGDDEKPVPAVRLKGSAINRLITPDGWTYEDSLSARFTFVESGRIPEYLDYLRTEDGLDVYRDLRTGVLIAS